MVESLQEIAANDADAQPLSRESETTSNLKLQGARLRGGLAGTRRRKFGTGEPCEPQP